ncbi:hypothetical protein [Metaclostridioides mangenotii]|nr:hypothetical protein [Clostridioides mangenotii]
MKKIFTTIIIIGIVAVGVIATQIKDINSNEYGTQITFKDNSGIWLEK